MLQHAVYSAGMHHVTPEVTAPHNATGVMAAQRQAQHRLPLSERTAQATGLQYSVGRAQRDRNGETHSYAFKVLSPARHCLCPLVQLRDEWPAQELAEMRHPAW